MPGRDGGKPGNNYKNQHETARNNQNHHEGGDTMTTKERREAARLVVQAMAMLPEAERRYIIGYAEGVIARSEADKEVKQCPR